jgi:hypothetical protein
MIIWLFCFEPVVRQHIVVGVCGGAKHTMTRGKDWDLIIPFEDTLPMT